MSGFQSRLTESSPGIAEELAQNQREISIAEFFEKNKHMLGFDSEARAIITAVKEAVDNAIDACEEAGVLPDIAVEITKSGNYYTLAVEDNGPGITREQLPKIFGKLLYGSKFGKIEQSRGQQGIGISAAVMYAQLTSGKPARITSRTQSQEKAQYFELRIDTDTNEPEIQTAEETDWDKAHGTRIEIELEANMRARSRLHTYMKNTAVVNPHARLTLDEPNLDEPRTFERAVEELPRETEEIRPHPHGVELGALQNMLAATESYSLSGFLQEEFTRVGQKTAEDILDSFRDSYYGREMAWDTAYLDADDLTEALTGAVSNKSADATDAFATAITDAVTSEERVAFHTLCTIVDETAEDIQDEYGERFGATVRNHAVDAAWEQIGDVRAEDVTALIDSVTTKRKDDDAIAEMGAFIARKFKQEEKDRATRTDLEAFIEQAAAKAEDETGETFGETAQEKIRDCLWGNMLTIDADVPNVSDVVDDRDMASSLLTGMNETKVMAPPTRCLSPITEDVVEAGLRKEYNADFYTASTRDAGVHAGNPFIVEAGLAYGGDIEAEGGIQLNRYANRVPLVYQPGACAITQTIKDIGWRNYKLSHPGGGLPQGPVVLVVHVASTNVPFTSESKDAVASVPELEDEIERAVRDVALDMKKYLKKQKSLQKRRRKQNVIADILPEIADKMASVADKDPVDVDGAMARIMNSVMVDTNGEEATIKNYSNSAETFTLELHFDQKPTYPSQNVTREETEDGWKLVFDGSMAKGDEATITWNLDDGGVPRVSVPDLPEEKLSVAA